MKHASPQPGSMQSGSEPVMGPTDLFFSTTDRRGVIRQGNSVFARVSGYPLEHLLDAPHNIVRHPEMPAGAFRLMWDYLEADRTVATYVCNLTADGGQYWVCAVVSPLDDGFLSVRVAPMTTGLTLVREVYDEALAIERDATTGGKNRRQVAEIGRAAIVAALQRRGFADYDAFMQAALVGERTTRQSLTLTAHQRPDATGEVARILDGTREVALVLEDLVRSLTTYQKLSAELAKATEGTLALTQQMAASVTAAQQASASVADRAPVLANVAAVMSAPMTAAVDDLRDLSQTFQRLHHSINDMRFQIALAATYTDMASGFAAEAWDGRAPLESLSAVPLLVDVADACVTDMAHQVRQVNSDLHAVSALVRASIDQLEEFRRMIGRWRQLTLRHAATALADQVEPVDAAVARTWLSTERLVQLSQRSTDAILPFDDAALHRHLASMRVNVAG
ncbi:PAS domain-containing protein [Nocardioides yefusunii]|uniref:PAS domain-containing protein n=1 Tax=Nocardioides yefusunii TaxID=2500546 RepID=A0ABW1QTG3_9ACTN|nr:PAS domain-containing protein [Nocardioides yefusunii]